MSRRLATNGRETSGILVRAFREPAFRRVEEVRLKSTKDITNDESKSGTRRRFLALGAALGGTLSSCKEPGAADNAARLLGEPTREYGSRSEFEKAARHMRTTKTPEAAASRTPLADSHGMITPSALHFERHHAGVPNIDPAEHKLLIHGMVERPIALTVDEIKRLPSVSRIHFIECSGNSGGEWGPKTAPEVRLSHGLASCSEWTGVPLSVLLNESGVDPAATWLLAEGADACKMQRSIPLDKGMKDAIVAYAQNGEAVRPEQGYPLRLVVPGWEGNQNVKWLRRIKVSDQAYMTKDETSKYTELLPDGRSRQFSFEMEVKSVITYPSGRQQLLAAGYYEIRGLAWSGRGAIERVEISVDGGESWEAAEVQEPSLPMAFSRFRFPWRWTGDETVLQSRAVDDQGYVQPSTEALIAARGRNSIYHHNGIKAWKVTPDGQVSAADG